MNESENSLSKSSRVSRRKFLGCAGLTAISALAGCNAVEKVSDPSQERMPSLDPSLPDRWVELDGISDARKFKGIPLSVYTQGRIYEDPNVKSDLKEVLPAPIEQPMVALFLAKANVFETGMFGNYFRGPLNADRILGRAFPQIKTKMKNEYGVGALREKSTRTKPEKAKSHQEFTTDYTVSRQKTVTVSGAEREVSLEGRLPIRLFGSCWPIDDGENYAIAGGVYPEQGSFSLSDSITGENGEGVDVTVTVDTGIEPSQVQARLIERINSVSL